MKSIVYVAILAAIVLGGVWQWRRASEAKRAEQAQEQRLQGEQKASEDQQRVALTAYANALRQHCETKMKTGERDLMELKADSKQMSEICSKIMDERDSRGTPLKYEVKILHVLENSDLNALALKHVGTDFTSIKAEFCERVRVARAAEEKYEAAVKEVDATYAETVKTAGNWGKMSSEQRNAEISRLRKEISQLEAKREKELKSFKSLSNMHLNNKRRERADHEAVIRDRIADTENQIVKKREQIDYLQSPNETSRIEANAVTRAQSEQYTATSRRQTAMYDIDRRLKPKTALVDVVSEYEAKTMGLLRSTLLGKIASAEKDTKVLMDKMNAIDEFLLSIPVTDLPELMQRKAKLDRKYDR